MIAAASAGGSPGSGQAKAPGAFRTIREVGDELDLPQHVLRFWETRFPQIKPLKRGGGRRYYRPEDVDLVRGVKALLYGQGYTIKGVQRILREGGVRIVQALGRGELVAVPSPDEPPEPAAEPLEAVPSVEAAAVAAAPGLAASDRAAIVGVLDELVACRRVLRALKQG